MGAAIRISKTSTSKCTYQAWADRSKSTWAAGGLCCLCRCRRCRWGSASASASWTFPCASRRSHPSSSRVPRHGGHLTGAQIAAALAKALGRECTGMTRRPRGVAASYSRASRTLATCSRSKRDFSAVFRSARNPGVLRALNPSLPRCDMWRAQNRSRTRLRSKRAALNASSSGFGLYAHPKYGLIEER
jgi:hypothetical protein